MLSQTPFLHQLAPMNKCILDLQLKWEVDYGIMHIKIFSLAHRESLINDWKSFLKVKDD